MSVCLCVNGWPLFSSHLSALRAVCLHWRARGVLPPLPVIPPSPQTPAEPPARGIICQWVTDGSAYMGIGSLFFPPERRFTLRKGFFPVIGKCAQAWRYFGAEHSRALQAVFDKQATGEKQKASKRWNKWHKGNKWWWWWGLYFTSDFLAAHWTWTAQK